MTYYTASSWYWAKLGGYTTPSQKEMLSRKVGLPFSGGRDTSVMAARTMRTITQPRLRAALSAVRSNRSVPTPNQNPGIPR